MNLAAVQYAPPKAQPDRARADICDMITRAAKDGADLIVCPEMATTGYVFGSPDEILPLAENAAGPTHVAVQEIVRRFETNVVVGFAERDGDLLFNSSMVVTPAATVIYRKVLLFELDETWATPGDRRHIVDVPGVGTVAPSICMDLNDIGFTSYCRRQAPDVVAFSANWLDQGTAVAPYWRWCMRGWRGWFVAANRWGSDLEIPFRGESCILDPTGRVRAQAPVAGDAILMVSTAS